MTGWSWFWLLVIIYFLVDTALFLHGFDTVFWKYKTPNELAAQRKRLGVTEHHLIKEEVHMSKQHESPQRWIPVEESLPDNDQTVMTYCPTSHEPVWIGYLDGETWCDTIGMPIYGHPVTHWMPFPEPPEAQ